MTDVFLKQAVGVCVGLALAMVVGLCLASPDDLFNVMLVSGVFCLAVVPLMLKWHYVLLLLSWNATLNAFFLPGQPDLWIVLVFVSFLLTILRRTLSREAPLLVVRPLALPMIVLGLVVLCTAMARGGIGLNAFGSASIGAKRYLSVIAAIIGFFVLSWQKLSKKQAILFASLFFIAGVSAAISDLIYFAGPSFYLLYYLFPSRLAYLQADSFSAMGNAVFRLEGVAWAAVAFFCFLLVRYGVRGMLDIRRPWRLLVLILTVVAGLFGGFRSRLLLMAAFFIVQFCLEGLWRTKYLAALGAGILLIGAGVLPFAEKLPAPVQRCLSFLPIEIDPAVQKDAEETLAWRQEMWRVLSPELPHYFWLGKGYTFSAAEFYLTQEAQMRGLAKSYDIFILTAEYHHGPLSVILPFGVWGMIAFVWLIAAGWIALYRNYKYGDPGLRRINTFLLTFFTVRTLFFFTIYGALNTELMLFTGVLGLSMAVNGGIRRVMPNIVPIPKQLQLQSA